MLVAIGAGAAAQGSLVLTKEGSAFYHWPGCPVVRSGEGVLAMNQGQAGQRDLQPHPACDPSKAPPVPGALSGAGSGARSLSGPAGPPSVFVDAVGKQYHRERCARLAKTSKQVALDASTVRKYWPCRACKPPIRPKKGRESQ